MCVLYCTPHEAREGRGEEKPEGRQHCSHWWKFQLSLCSASLAHCFFSFIPLSSSEFSLSLLVSFFTLFSSFCITPLISLQSFHPPVPQHPTLLHANSVAPYVPLCFFSPLSSFSLSPISRLLSLLSHRLYCHTGYLSQTLSQWLSVLSIGTCSTADFHSNCLIRE